MRAVKQATRIFNHRATTLDNPGVSRRSPCVPSPFGNGRQSAGPVDMVPDLTNPERFGMAPGCPRVAETLSVQGASLRNASGTGTSMAKAGAGIRRPPCRSCAAACACPAAKSWCPTGTTPAARSHWLRAPLPLGNRYLSSGTKSEASCIAASPWRSSRRRWPSACDTP